MASAVHRTPIMATTSNEDLIARLNDLVQLDHDAVAAYDEAVEKIDDLDIRDDLDQFRLDHKQHITDLQQVIRELGGEPQDVGRDIEGVLHDSLGQVHSATGTIAALRAMRGTEQVANQSYERMLDPSLPATAHELVERNLEDERRHLATIESHLARLEPVSVELEERPELEEGYTTQPPASTRSPS